MELSLEASGRRQILLIVALAISAVLIFQAGEVWLANHRLDSEEIATMERGARLMPGDGSAWDRLGRLRQWDFVNPDLPGAVADYWKAVGDDPRSAHYWMDLAGAYEAMGDDAPALDAYRRAKAAYPASAEVDFYFGNFLLRDENYPQAYAELQHAVRTDPTLLPLAISRTWRSSEDIDELLNNVLPANTEAYLETLDFFASIHQAGPGLAVWKRLVELGKPIPLSRAFAFFDELIREDRAGEARDAWRGAVAVAGLPRDESSSQNLIWNGKFAREFLNGGLDWRWEPQADADMSVDSEPGPNGSRAIRIDFGGGTNLSVVAPEQYVPVEPAHRYHFQAFLRTEGITTESGMRFRITDPNHNGALNVQTDNLTGSHPWTVAQTDFDTPSDTHFLLVQLFRAQSRLFENKLEGTVRIADVSVSPLSESTGQAPR